MLRPVARPLILLVTACASAPSAPAAESPAAPLDATGAAPAPSTKPQPPSDLDLRLVAEYPLRGFVLRESGRARVRFSIDASGKATTSDVLQASQSEYGAACRRMLEGTIWTPARRAGAPVPFSSVFDCRFEHADARGQRGVTTPAIATPPVPPDYGTRWWGRYAEAFARRDATAELDITVGVEGRVRVNAVRQGSAPEVAKPCATLLQEGPRWTPAKDAAGNAVEYRGPFHCRLELSSLRKELYVKQVGTLGPIAPAQLAAVAADRFQDLVACFESAVYLGKAVQGQHWLAFEIRARGDIGRVEWIERPLGDPAIDACAEEALRRWRFPPAAQRTIADLQLYLGGRM